MVNPKNSALTRGFQLGKLGVKLAGSYLGYQAQNLVLGESERPRRAARFQERASRRMREELGDLKGPAMKLGQLVSMANGAMQPEALEELAHLQMRAPGMHASLARAQFKSALGKYPEELFREFDPEPFAAASLGQVHRAVTRSGDAVAVKIQYPAIRTAIENDFKLFRSVTLPGQITGHLPAGLVAEVERGILEETDYLQEAQNLEFFRKELKGLAYLSIPRVFHELSGDRVLTMSFIEGISLRDFLRAKPSSAMRDLVGDRLAEMYYTQLHWLKAFHADHHPGNYLFRTDGSFGLVDFGCVKRLRIDITKIVDSFIGRSWRQSDAAARRFLELVYGAEVPHRRARKLLPVAERTADFLFPQGPSANPVANFRDPELLKLAANNSKQIFLDRSYPAEFAFVSRAEVGLWHLMQELGARVNIGAVWRRVSTARSIGEYEHGDAMRTK
jgi:predicted unusual protein kinase regulating ubiquinone biosynthesis (AarF/ABC1/UbiB family)